MSEPGLLEIRIMPSRQTLRRARRDKREGNSAASPHALAEQAHRAAGPTQQGAALGSCETSGADEGSGTAIRSRKKGSKNPRHALAQTRAAGAFCSSASSGLAAAPLRFNPLQTR